MARSAPPPTVGARLGALLSSPLGRGLLRGLGVALIILVGGVVVRQARARAYRLDAYRLGPEALHYLDLHPALGPDVAASLKSVRFSVSVFDSDAEARIRQAIARHPLVAAVRSVVIRYPDRVDVKVTVRRPAAWFEGRTWDGRRGTFLVSTDCRVLPPRSYRHWRRHLRIPLPIVRGVTAAAPRYYGQAWEDIREQVPEGIAAAHVAAHLYRDFNGMFYVKTIDVSAFPAQPDRRRRGEVRLHLDDGTVVEWGRTERDMDGVAGEDTYATKRRRLETLRPGALVKRSKRIDVRFRLRGEGLPLARDR
jgi:hypothetical protein